MCMSMSGMRLIFCCSITDLDAGSTAATNGRRRDSRRRWVLGTLPHNTSDSKLPACSWNSFWWSVLLEHHSSYASWNLHPALSWCTSHPQNALSVACASFHVQVSLVHDMCGTLYLFTCPTTTCICTVCMYTAGLQLRFGPLVRYWTMRYEARHHFFKRLAQNVGNFINLSYTLAVRHQLLQCYYHQSEAFLGSEVEIGPGT